jgi:chorismate mutase
MSDKLVKYRKKIDEIDKNIINLLSKRLYIVNKIGKIKHQLDIPIDDSAREKEILKRLYQLDGHSISREHLKLIFDTIFKISKDNQKVI